MKLPKRFALSTLLIVMLLVSLVFGYAQWRRQWLIKEVEDLNNEGIMGISVDGNAFWPVASHPNVFIEVFYSKEFGELYFGLKEQPVATATAIISMLSERLENIGVTHVSWLFFDLDDPTSTAVDFSGDVDYLSSRINGGR